MFVFFFFLAEDCIRDAHWCLEFRRVLFRSGDVEPQLVRRVFLCLTLPVSTSLPGAQAPGLSFALRDPFGLARRSRPGRRRPSLCSADHSPTWSISHGPQTDKAPHAQERRPSRAAHRGATQAQGQRARRVEEAGERSEEHTSELQSLMRNSYAVFCLKK